jgi:hypothetical protein
MLKFLMKFILMIKNVAVCLFFLFLSCEYGEQALRD